MSSIKPLTEMPTTYDETPYPAASFPQSHPNRSAAMARLFGVNAKDPSKARVLELGCANGANLLPMAEQMPDASFLGIDASRVQLEAGNQALKEAALTNIELRFQNILDFPTSEGKFDYIIAHGIYSWVPQPVREKMLAICRDHLTESGIAYISYNALPGWNMRRSLRDMMLFHTRALSDPRAKVQQARALLKFLADNVPTEKSAYGMLLKSELDVFSKAADNYFRHDILEEENTAFYFHEFCQQADVYGLQYLSEPNLFQMLAGNFPEKVSKTLAQVGSNIVAQEQYMDFIRNRFFRQTLLCRHKVNIVRHVSDQSMRKFAFQSLLKVRPDPVDLASGVAVEFEGLGGNKLTAADPFVKAAFELLAQSTARALSFDQLLQGARAKSRRLVSATGEEQDRTEESTLMSNLFKLYVKGFVEILAEPVAISLSVPEKPVLSRLMHHQAAHAPYVTNRTHQALPIDMVGRFMIDACDGTRTEQQIVDTLVQRASEGKIQVSESNEPVKDPARVRALLAPRVNALLGILARNGFFAPTE